MAQKIYTGICEGSDASNYTLQLVLTDTILSIPNNQSKLTQTLRIKRNSSSPSASYGTAECQIRKMDGISSTGNKNYDLRNTTAWKTLWEVTEIITHSSNGTGKILKENIYAWWIKTTESTYLQAGFVQNVAEDFILETIPRSSTITSLTNFNIDTGVSNISITKYVSEYYDSLKIKYGATTIKTIDDIENGDSITFSVEELNTIYGLMSSVNSGTFTFELSTYTDGTKTTQMGSTNSYSVTGIITNANPVFNNFTYEDNNAITVALTGNNQTIIAGYSNLLATIDVVNKAMAQKGASMVSYQLVVGNKQITASYNADEDVTLQLNAINNNIFILYAIDSRGNSTSKQISPTTYINFTPLIVSSAKADRTDGTTDDTTLTANGTFYAINFGNVANSIEATYQYKKTGDVSYIDGTSSITITESDNTYSIEQTIKGDMISGNLGFDPAYSYNIKLTVSDKLSSFIYMFLLNSGTPNIALSDSGVAIGKVATEEEMLDSAWDINTDKGITFAENINDVSADELNYVKGVTSPIQDQIDGKRAEALAISLSEVQNITASQTTKINFDVEGVKIGDKLSFSSAKHRIIIGEGISAVKIYAGAHLRTNSATILGRIMIYKNGSQLLATGQQTGNTTYVQENLTLFTIEEVEEDDYFEVYVNSASNGNVYDGRQTTLIVESI